MELIIAVSRGKGEGKMSDLKRTEWMYQKKWGVFIHQLHRQINVSTHPKSMGKETSWNEAIDDFDCELFASQLHEVGAGWCVVTIMQQTKHMIAPNETFDKITGYQPGEACAKTDFIEKMYDALSKYDIDLILYYTGDGPIADEQAKKAFGAYHIDGKPLTEEFVQKWADVAREYSLRYGKKVKGWWQDGMWIGYTPELLKIYADAFHAGNPDAVIASNFYGCLDEFGNFVTMPRKGCPYDDFTAGELVHLGAVPYAPDIALTGCRWHALSFLGVPEVEYDGWGEPGSKYTPGWMYDYVDKIHKKGGIITLDICAYRDGHIDEEQMRVLRVLKTV